MNMCKSAFTSPITDTRAPRTSALNKPGEPGRETALTGLHVITDDQSQLLLRPLMGSLQAKSTVAVLEFSGYMLCWELKVL